MRITSLFSLCLALATLPATAQVIYSNGPTNGNTGAWQFNFGLVVSDTFNVSVANTTITGLDFAVWFVNPDTLSSVELSITSAENGGTSYFDQALNVTQTGCVVNIYTLNVCNETTSFAGPTLNAGTYWLNLQNGQAEGGDPVYWDQNSGPSLASQNQAGTIPSESFTVFGSGTTTTGSSAPEPSSIMLFGSGILGLAGMTRRKFF